MLRILFVAAAALMVLGELVALIFRWSHWRLNPDILHIWHLLLLAFAAVLAFLVRKRVITEYQTGADERNFARPMATLILVGVIFSLLATFVNSNLVKLTFILRPQAVLYIIFFLVYHGLYIAALFMFSESAASVGFESRASRIRLAVTFLAWPIISIGLWYLLIPHYVSDKIEYFSATYFLAATLPALIAVWVYIDWGDKGLFILAAGALLLISDAIGGYYLYRHISFYPARLVWLTGYLALLNIIWAPLAPATTKISSGGKLNIGKPRNEQ